MTYNGKFMFVRSYLFLEIFVKFISFTHCLELDVYLDPVFGDSDKFSPVNEYESSLTIFDNNKTETGGKKLNGTGGLQENKPNQTICDIGNSTLSIFRQNNISEKQILKDENLRKSFNEEEPVKDSELHNQKPKTSPEKDDTDHPKLMLAQNANEVAALKKILAPDPFLKHLPQVKDMFGIELKTAVYIVAALGIVHVFFYGCILFTNLSYMLVTIMVLVFLYSAISLVLFIFLPKPYSALVLRIWVWYSLFFVVMMCLMMILVAAWFCVRSEYKRLPVAFLGLAWYALTTYFILVVNTYRMQLPSVEDTIKAARPT